MTLNQEVEIIYLYIVANHSMERVADELGWDMKTVSETVRGYGFNNDYAVRTEWTGKDKGRYAKGKSACRGVNVTRQIIKEYLEYADEWDWDFEWYISDIAEGMAEQNQRQREQEQRNAQYQRQMEQQRIQAEQNARMERERREKEAREQQIRQQEYERQQKEQEKRNTNEYYRLLDIGKKALKENRLQEALDRFYDARKLYDAIELYALIAQVLAISKNADAHCQSIISELREYENCIKREGKQLSLDQFLWYARALVAANQPSSAATRYSMAADIHYKNKNYVAADSVYKESYNKTGIFTNWGTDKFFKLAYSRSCISNMTKDDHQFCIDAYFESNSNNEGPLSTSLGNMAWHYIKLGNNKEAVSRCESAIVFGNNEPYVYHNLVEACMNLGQYDKAYKTFEKMDKLNISYQPWKKAECIYHGNLFGDRSRSEAEVLYKQQISVHGFHIHSCYMLLFICKSDLEACQYGLKYIVNEKKETEVYRQAAETYLRRARSSGDKVHISIALDYNPEEKKKVEEQEAQERKRLVEQRLERERLERERQEKIRLVAEQQEKQRLEMERLEKERQEREERERQELLKKKEEEELLMVLL